MNRFACRSSIRESRRSRGRLVVDAWGISEKASGGHEREYRLVERDTKRRIPRITAAKAEFLASATAATRGPIADHRESSRKLSALTRLGVDVSSGVARNVARSTLRAERRGDVLFSWASFERWIELIVTNRGTLGVA